MKTVVVGILIAACMVMSASADIYWSLYGNGNYFLKNSSLTPLTASDADSSVGVFLQLIHVTSGLTAHSPNPFAIDGVSGGDTVLAWDFLGHGDVTEFGDPTVTPGQWSQGAIFDGSGLVVDQAYFIRAWNLPSTNFAAGDIRHATGLEYADSAVTIYNGARANMNPTLDGDMITHAIPEPAMLGLGVIGLISLRFFGRKRK